MFVQLLALIAILLCCAVGTVVGLQDRTLTITQALPNGAATVSSAGIDLESTPVTADFVPHVEFTVTIPALTVTELADTQTITYSVETSAASNFSSPTVLISSLAVQTGAGGIGSLGSVKRFQVATDSQRYIRVKAVKTGASNASTSSMIFRLVQLG